MTSTAGRLARALVFAAALAALPLGCHDRRGPLRVGAKDFAEQAILAQILVGLLRDRGWADATHVPCGDTYSCHQAMREGKLDVLVDYTGTGLAFLGAEVPRRSGLSRVRALYRPLGMEWLVPLGFDNGYRILVASRRAAAKKLETIGDLARLDRGEGLRVACPSEYLRRPMDSLASLARRYGLRLAPKPVVVADPQDRFQALYDGRADVAVGYATDGAITSLDLKGLRDDLLFFPSYEAVVVVRRPLLKQEQGLGAALGTLKGKLGTGAMRRLNYQAQVEGRQPKTIARRFLLERKLLSGDAKGAMGKHRPELVVAVHPDDDLEYVTTRAVRAVRSVFRDRVVSLKTTPDPIDRVSGGGARLAVLGAERFFSRAGVGTPSRDSRLEAVAVLSTRLLHLVRRADEDLGDKGVLAGRVGVSEEGSGGARVAMGLLAAEGKEAAADDSPAKILGRVGARSLDAALILAPAGDPGLARALAGGKLRLHALSNGGKAPVVAPGGWLGPERAVQLPYLRPSRIPGRTYADQPRSVETLGVQVVLAGPSRRNAVATGESGPAAALPSTGRPLTRKQVSDLAMATGVASAPDPVLPSAWSVKPSTADPAASSGPGVLDTALNVLAIGFVAWLVSLVLRRRKGGGAA